MSAVALHLHQAYKRIGLLAAVCAAVSAAASCPDSASSNISACPYQAEITRVPCRTECSLQACLAKLSMVFLAKEPAWLLYTFSLTVKSVKEPAKVSEP